MQILPTAVESRNWATVQPSLTPSLGCHCNLRCATYTPSQESALQHHQFLPYTILFQKQDEQDFLLSLEGLCKEGSICGHLEGGCGRLGVKEMPSTPSHPPTHPARSHSIDFMDGPSLAERHTFLNNNSKLKNVQRRDIVRRKT